MAGKKGQHYLTEDERYIMEGMLLAGAGPTEIARKMGICRQTVYNEMKRGLYVHTCDLQDQIRYSADKAQQIHDYNQTAKGRPLKIGNDHALADYLEKKMLGIQPNGKRDRRKRFSPSAALAAARAEGFTTSVCPSTLYSYIDKRAWRVLPRPVWFPAWTCRGRGHLRPPGPGAGKRTAPADRRTGQGYVSRRDLLCNTKFLQLRSCSGVVCVTLFHEEFQQGHENEDRDASDENCGNFRGEPGPEDLEGFADGAEEVHQLRQVLEEAVYQVD